MSGTSGSYSTGGGAQELVTTSLVPQVFTAGSYVDARANNDSNLADLILLSDGTRVDTGKVTWVGHGMTVGAYYYLSQTVQGTATDIVPSLGLIQRLWFVEDADTVHILVNEAYGLGSTISTDEVAVFVPLDTPVSLDNIRIEARLTGGQGFRIGTVAGTINYDISATNTYATDSTFGSNRVNLTMTTAMTHPFIWSGQTDGDSMWGHIHDLTNSKFYEFNVKTSVAPDLSFVRIKRLAGAVTVPSANAGNIPVATFGDVKTGLQAADHAGWIKLDGRALATLTATQQAQATALGIVANLPNGAFAYLTQGPALGAVTGANTRNLAQNNLPNVTIATSGAIVGGTTLGASGNPGGTDPGLIRRSNGSSTTIAASVDVSANEPNLQANLENHNHSFLLNGGVAQVAVDITPRSLGVNYFLYLGA